MTSPPTKCPNQNASIPTEPSPNQNQSTNPISSNHHSHAQYDINQIVQSKIQDQHKINPPSTTMNLSHTNTQLHNPTTSTNNTTTKLTIQQHHQLSKVCHKNPLTTVNLPSQIQSLSHNPSISVRNRPSLPPLIIHENQTNPIDKPAPLTFETNPSPNITPQANHTMENIREDISLSPSSDNPPTTTPALIPTKNISTNIDPTISTLREGKRRTGRPPNINENSLIRRLQCVMAVELECISMNLACEFYKISSRTFYRWLRNKKRLLELTGYQPEDFAIGGCMDVTKHPIIPVIEPVNKSSQPIENDTQQKRNDEKDKNLLPSTLSRISPTIIPNGQNDGNIDEDNNSGVIDMTKNICTPETVDDSNEPMITRKQVDGNNTKEGDTENPVRVPTVTEVRLEVARSTTRMRATLNRELPAQKQGDNDKNMPVDGSGADSQDRLLKRRRSSSDTQGQQKETRDWQGPENIIKTPKQAPSSKDTHRQINSTRNSAMTLENEEVPIACASELIGPNNSSIRKEITGTMDHVRPTELRDPTLLSTETNREYMVTRGKDVEPNRLAVYPSQYKYIDRRNDMHRNQMECCSYMNVKALRREQMCPHMQRICIEQLSSGQVELHRLEIMHGRRREVIKWYDGTPVEEIKEAVMLRFGLPPKLRWSLLDRSNEEVLISTHVKSGKYTLNVYQ